jgi:hypothetical protein
LHGSLFLVCHPQLNQAAKTTEDLIARIAAIAIQGQVVDTPAAVSATDRGGFVADDIGPSAKPAQSSR